MKKVITLPHTFLTYIIKSQLKRKYHPANLLLFSTIVGLIRAFEERILFNSPLPAREYLSYITFYWSLGFLLTYVLHKITNLSWKRVQNVILIGIFLGVFPPLIDRFILGQNHVAYGYYYLSNFRQLPWLAYDPKMLFPLGETITIWLSIFFSGYFAYNNTRKKPIISFLIAIVIVYLVFIFQSSFLPMALARLSIGKIINLKALKSFDTLSLKPLIHHLALWQTILVFIIYIFLNDKIFKLIRHRFIHVMPFILISILGYTFVSNKLNFQFIYPPLLTAIISVSAIIHNEYFDARLEENRKSLISEQDLFFIHAIIAFSLLFPFLMGQTYTIALFIAFIMSILYHFPFYRAKRYFPANMKTEGIWGLCCFLSGVLIMEYKQFTTKDILLFLLIFGGFSIISMLKDAKDIMQDRHAKNNTTYIFFLNKGYSLRKIHYTICFLASLCITIPLYWIARFSNFYFAFFTLLLIIMPAYYFIIKSLSYRYFKYFMFSMSLLILNVIIVQILRV